MPGSRTARRLLSTGTWHLAPGGPGTWHLAPAPWHLAQRTVSRPNDLIQGTLDLLVLKMLALNSMNGWDISQRLKQISNDALQVSDGSLYPALHKLEQEGWITAEWRPSENNRRAKFYSLTRAGKKQLQLETNNWDRLAAAITAVVRLKEV